jgi:glycosyltransferase involved in cell wall biosynthesis
MFDGRDHISVCICTYKRPELLRELLGRLKGQRTEGLFTFSAVVVDNDAQESGRGAAQSSHDEARLPVSYQVEPERNISLARNRSIENARGELIAFIDDDELPEDDWLFQHHRALRASRSDGVLGPVKPRYDPLTPAWLVKSRLLERGGFPTGYVIKSYRDTRTGNALLLKSVFADEADRFDPRFGKTGGGDAVFFKRMLGKGKTFIWCEEAVVFETVPPERRRRSYYLKRALTRGMVEGRQSRFLSMTTLRSCVAIPLYALALPFTLLMGQHVFMKYLVKECDHLSKVLAHFGIMPAKERPYEGTAVPSPRDPA